jgi:hypothetical protein
MIFLGPQIPAGLSATLEHTALVPTLSDSAATAVFPVASTRDLKCLPWRRSLSTICPIHPRALRRGSAN